MSKRYCQSCGMPLRFDMEEWLGTNLDGSKSDTFCYYCLKDGKYTVDVSMHEMIDIWLKYINKYNMYAHTVYSPEELKMILEKRLPTLNRWKQKQDTKNVHNQAIQSIVNYISNHLFEDFNIIALCQKCGMSEYHFRRVFKFIIGENIGNYIQRLRLEYAAHLLTSTEYTLSRIAELAGYQSKYSIAKAFKKHFGVSTSLFKERFTPRKRNEHTSLTPRIIMINKMFVSCLEVGKAYENKFQYKVVWDKLLYYARFNRIDKRHTNFVSLSLDNPAITPEDKCRFYLGIIMNDIPDAKLITIQIPNGQYAIFRHIGSYDFLCDLYRIIYEEWFPDSQYYPQNTFSFEVYINSPCDTDVPELITDIYIPVVKKKTFTDIKYSMEKISEIALFQQSETYALVVETRTTVKEIAMTIGRSFMEIETLFKEQNAVMADVPFVEYLNFESMSEDIHMIIGFKSAKILCGKGNIRAITIPGRKIVSCLHKGNYTELASLYREMQEWIAAKGYKPSGASIEYYYSKPGTSEEELATKVEMPVL